MNWKIAAALVAALAAPGWAQEAPGAEGPGGGPPLGDGPREVAATTALSSKRIVRPARRVVLPAIDAQPLLDEDAERAATPDVKADPRVAVMRTFREVAAPRRLVPGARGVETLPDGSLVWSLEIGSPGAAGLRLHVSRCDLPKGATVVVHDAAEPKEAYGPFTGRGPDGSGAFFLPTVFGETARVEVRVPAASAGARLRFAIDRVAQRYRERGEGMEDPRIGVVVKAGGGCNNNVACDAGFLADVARGVATMEITTTGGVFLCSGCLLNDSDVTTAVPYFLTAHHCLSLEREANDTEFFFDYRAAACSGSPPPISSVPRVSGATLLASSTSSDYTLLRLTGTLPPNRFFCGWTAARQTSGEAVVGVHHPGGSAMRISYGTLLQPDGSFHQVQWSSGVTAPGSSGSPLFNPSKQVIGQLYGGASSCALQSGIDEYGRFDRTYPSLSQFLGASAGGSTTDAWDPDDDAIATATLLTPGLFGQSSGSHVLSKDDPADWFAFDLVGGRRYRFFSTGRDDVRATLYSDVNATVVAVSDDDSAGSGQFSIDFTPVVSGRHSLRVATAVSAAAAEYSLVYEQVDETQTRTPAAVAKLRKSVDSGDVTLRWRDRARNETGYFVDVSQDGSEWTRVAELPRNATTFTDDPGAGVHRYRVGAWNATGAIRYHEVSATVVDPDMLDAFDPADDSGAGATTLAPASGGTTVARTFSRADTEDWFRIDLAAGGTWVFETLGGVDTAGTLFDDPAGEAFVASDDDGGVGRNFRIVFTATRTGSYWLRVTPFVDGDLMTYALRWRRK